MEKPLISVIVAVYNTEPYLERCLRSLECQTYGNIEVLLVDDGSTDGSASICKAFCERDSRFVYVRQTNAGQSAARNNGLDHAQGAYVSCVDSDDYVDPDFLEYLYGGLIENGAQLAQCQSKHEGFPGISEAMEAGEIKCSICTGDEMITNILLSANGFKASFREVLVSADLLSSRRFLEGHIFEDLELLAVMAQGIRKAVSLPGRKYHYCYRKNNSSSRALRLRKDDLDVVVGSIRDHLRGSAPEHLPEVDARFISNALVLTRSAATSDAKLFRELRGEILACDYVACRHTKSERIMYAGLKYGRIAFLAASGSYEVFRKFRYRLTAAPSREL